MTHKSFLGASALGAGLLLVLAIPTSASAHVSVAPSHTAAGSSSVLTFAFGHGCEGSPTTSIAISIPDGINAVTPTINPGWTVEKIMEPLDDATTDNHGETLAERVSSVVYTAITPIPDGLRDTLALSLTLPEGEEGDELDFTTTQGCEIGESVWSGDDAPVVVLSAADESGDQEAEAAAVAPAQQTGNDTLARVFGIGGLVVGAVGIVLAANARRAVRG